jgi:hypothetical protein
MPALQLKMVCVHVRQHLSGCVTHHCPVTPLETLVLLLLHLHTDAV